MLGPSLRYLRLLLPVTLLVSASGPQAAPERLAVAGTVSLTAKASANSGKGADGRPLFVGQSEGENRSTGKDEFMNGAEVASADTASLVDGNGPHHGYITMSKGGDRVVFKWSGAVTTVAASDRVPETTAKGTWTVLRGMGKYDGASGGGTYTCRFTSSTVSVINWKGEIGR